MPAERNHKSSVKTHVQSISHEIHRQNDAEYNQENSARKSAQIPAKLSTKLNETQKNKTKQ